MAMTDRSPTSGLVFFLRDVKTGLQNYRIWLTFGWLDIKLRYRRTFLGPFWLILSFTIAAAAMGFIYSTLFSVELEEYLPYLISGLAIWGFLSTMINEGCMTFMNSSQIILENKMPLSLHVLRMLVRNTVIFFHSILVVFLIGTYFTVPYDISVLLAVPALVLLILNGFWMAILVGMVCTRYRDVPQIVQLVLQITFFITPIFWQREMMPSRAYVIDFNPLFHFVDILRAPLIGKEASLTSWSVVLGITVVGWLLTVIFGARYMKRLTYWL